VNCVDVAMSEPSTQAVLSMNGIVKFYGPNKVLSGVDFSIRPGEIVGLVGANGAGKTTLLRILAGITPPSSGTMSFGNQNVSFGAYNPLEAWEHGVAMVYQGLSLCTNMAVWENWSFRYGRVAPKNRRARTVEAQQMLENIFPANNVSPRAIVAELPLAQRQMVEIARAASHPWLKLLVLDEPSSALSGESSTKLHNYVKQLTSRGTSVIYVTHKLDEILGLADRLVVLRNGEVRWTGEARGISRRQLVEELGGRAIEEGEMARQPGAQPATYTDPLRITSRPSANTGERAVRRTPGVVVRVEGLYGNTLRGVDLVAAECEIVGLAGLEGAGQRDLVQAVFHRGRGIARGHVTVAGSVAYVAGDRDREGTFELWDIYRNILIGAARLKRVVAAGRIRWREADAVVQQWFKELDIAASSPKVPIKALSGGNQQKVLLARAFSSEARVLLLDDPTRGVDVATKAAVYAALTAQRASGRTVIVYSTEDAEFQYCDRVYVFAEGRISGELVGANISGPEIVRLSYEHGESSIYAGPDESRGPVRRPDPVSAPHKGGTLT